MAAERNSFADRINEQRPPTHPLSAIAPLLRVRQVEVQDLCRFASAWRSAHTAEAPSWAQFHMVTKGKCFLDLEKWRNIPSAGGQPPRKRNHRPSLLEKLKSWRRFDCSVALPEPETHGSRAAAALLAASRPLGRGALGRH
jgi:hypothetical protein